MVKTTFSKFGEITTVRLSKLNVFPYMGTIKIGYVVYKMAISAN